MTSHSSATGDRNLTIAKNVKRLIRGFAAFIILYFGFLEIKDAPIDKIAATFDSYSFIKLGLFIFFIGWLIGANKDTEIQAAALSVDPRFAKLSEQEWIAILGFFIAFFVLFLFRDSIILFQIALLIFILINTRTYQTVLNRIDDMARVSSEIYLNPKKRKNFDYVKLYCIMSYLKGPWQAKRFITLIALAFAQLLISVGVFYALHVRYLPNLPVWKTDLHTLINYLPSMLFVIYVIVSEYWMKIYRTKVFAEINLLDTLDDRFSLAKREGIDLPEIDYDRLFAKRHSYNPNYSPASLIDMLTPE